MRATESVPLPAAKGTTIVIGAEGYVWLIAAEAANKLAAKIKTRGKIFMKRLRL
jgi:exosome complex RNA-binding protein Rrp4